VPIVLAVGETKDYLTVPPLMASDHCHSVTRIRRRTILRGTIGAAVGAVSVSALTGSAAARGAGNGGPEEFVQPGANLFDINEDGTTNLILQSAADPATSRGSVTHATSNGNQTVDYATSVIAVGQLSFSEFTAPQNHTLTYEYYEGPNNRGAAPDEVWVYVEDDDGDKRVFYRASNDENPEPTPDEQWLTRNIHKEILGNPDHNIGFK
jgi:hypothetical protein